MSSLQSTEKRDINQKEAKLCEVCNLKERQYKCPRCSAFTCSLICCREHKRKSNCSGVRDKVAYVPPQELDSSHLRSDFHFLEDILQTKSGAKRSFINCGGDSSTIIKKRKKSKPVQSTIIEKPQQNLESYAVETRDFVYEAHSRGTKLLLMPQGMSRRNENDSFYDRNKKVIYWKIAVVAILSENALFHDILNADVSKTNNDNLASFSMLKVDENAILSHFISHSLDKIETSSIRAQLLRLHDAQDLHCLIRVLPSEASNPKFCELTVDDTIRSNLTGQTVIEYPTFFICSGNVMKSLRLLVSEQSRDVLAEPCHPRSSLPLTTAQIYVDPDISQLCAHVEDNVLEDDDNLNLYTPLDSQIEHLAYEEFMKALSDLQSHDIQSLKEIIASEVAEDENE